jgi:hypothetical protein
MVAMIAQVLDCLKTIIGSLMRHRFDERKLRIELYDRRIAVFNAVRDYMWSVASGNVQREAEQKFLQHTQHVSFLFDKSIKLFVEEVFQKAGKLHALLATESRLSGKALEENLDKQNAIREWLMRETKRLDRRFGKYLNL